jgi:hypothetical protein
MASEIVTGNAAAMDPQAGQRGWFLGHFFKDATDPRFNPDVELKWAVHEQGSQRPCWAFNRTATTIVVLISGQYRLQFRDRDVVLHQPGDYVLWGPNVSHSWTAEATSTVLVVRFPSLPDDSVNLDP